MDTATAFRTKTYRQLVGRMVGGRYRLEALLGYGGMGAVFRALQETMQRRVAVKLIPQGDPRAAARFKREALTISQLRHPNTVTVFDYGETDDAMLFLTMELLAGHTLGDLIKEIAPLPPRRAVHIAAQVCRSLSEAHQAGIVHRDIKPDNIFLIAVDDDPDFVKVLDFGIAKIVQAEDQVTLTGEGRIIGTPKYMSPEQILAEPVDHRSDIYSLACIVYEMLCGKPPFDDGSTTKLMISHAKEAPPPLSERLSDEALSQIPGALESVVRRALSKAPDERQANIEELRRELLIAVDALDPPVCPSMAASALPAPGISPSGPSHPPDSSDLLTVHSSQSLERLRPSSQASTAQASPGAPSALGVAQPSKSKTRLLLIAGIVVLAAFIAVTAYIASQGAQKHEETAPPQALVEPGPPAQAPAAAAPAPIRLRVNSVPGGAEVIADGQAWGRTPLDRSLPADTKSLNLEVTLEGFEPSQRLVQLDGTPGALKVLDFSLAERRDPAPSAEQRPAKPQRQAKPARTPKTKPELKDRQAQANSSADRQPDTPRTPQEPNEPESPPTPDDLQKPVDQDRQTPPKIDIERLDDDKPNIMRLD